MKPVAYTGWATPGASHPQQTGVMNNTAGTQPYVPQGQQQYAPQQYVPQQGYGQQQTYQPQMQQNAPPVYGNTQPSYPPATAGREK